MTTDDPEIERLRTEVSCATLLERLPPPWLLDRAESTKNCLKYRRGAGEVIIVNHEGRGWWDPQSDARGDIFDLVQHFDPGLNFGQVRKLLRPFIGLSASYPAAPRGRDRESSSPAPAERWARRPTLRPASPGWRYRRKHRPLAMPFLPPCPEQSERVGREHGIAISAAFTALDADQHALAVDIADFERSDFGDPQACTIGNAQCGAVLGGGSRGEQSGYLLGAEHRRQLAGIGHAEQLARQVWSIDRGCEEKPQARDMAVHRWRRHPRLALLDLEPTNVFRCGEIRRPSEESGETRDDAQIIMLGLRRKTPDVHIFDHPLAKITASRHGKRLVHGGLLSN
jgi:hypothetical protein